MGRRCIDLTSRPLDQDIWRVRIDLVFGVRDLGPSPFSKGIDSQEADDIRSGVSPRGCGLWIDQYVFFGIRGVAELETHCRVLLNALTPRRDVKILANVSSRQSESHDGLLGHFREWAGNLEVHVKTRVVDGNRYQHLAVVRNL